VIDIEGFIILITIPQIVDFQIITDLCNVVKDMPTLINAASGTATARLFVLQ
jgi:hypothetical protein